MKILLFFATVCATVHVEACFCVKADAVQEPCNVKKNVQAQQVSSQTSNVSSVGTLTSFFESLLLVNKKQTHVDVKKHSVDAWFKKLSSHEDCDFSEDEDLCHKELREQFERGDFDHLYGPYKELSTPIVLPLPVSESEECVTRRVITSIVSEKAFSLEKVQEYNDVLVGWFECMKIHDVGCPVEYLIARNYLERILNSKG
jgi:hypothetical protein